MRALLAPMLLLSATLAHAQEGRPLVLLSGPAEADPLVARLHEELVAMGLRVEVVPPRTGEDAFARLATERRAAALARVEEDSRRVWIRVGDDPPERVTGGDRDTVALAAAEVLRGRLVDVADVAEPEPAATASGRALPDVALRADVGVRWSPGGVPLHLALELGAEWWVWGPVYVEAVTALGLPGVTDVGARTQAPFWAGTLGAGVGLSVLPRDLRVGLQASVGAGGLGVVYEDENKQRSVWAALPYAHVGTRYRLADAMCLRLDASAAAALPEPTLKLTASERVRFGHPLVSLSVGVDVAF